MLQASDSRYWRRKALTFRTDAAGATDPVLIRRLNEFAMGCERTAFGLEDALAAREVPDRASGRAMAAA
jgi:hypothetical protein